MAPWLLLSLALAQTPDPAAADDAQRTQEEALRRQGEAQSRDGTLDGGTSSTGSPDPSLMGTGGAGDAGTGGAGTDTALPPAGVDSAGGPDGGTAPYTVPSPFPDTGGAGDAGTGGAGAPQYAPGSGSTAPGSTGPAQAPTPQTGESDGGRRRPLDTGAAPQGSQAAAGDEADTGEDSETDEAGTVSMGAMEIEGPASAATPEEAAAALRAQVQALQEREQALTEQQQALQERTEALEAELAETQERAQALEEARVQRLETLEDVRGLLVDADTALSVGDDDVEAQVYDALQALEAVAQSADESGQGDTVLATEGALEDLSYVMDAVQRRDYYPARLLLQAAAARVRGAQRSSLQQTEGALLQGGSNAAPVEPSSEAPPTEPGY